MKELKVKITFITPILGSASGNKDLHTEFIASKAPDAPSREEEVESLGAEEVRMGLSKGFPDLFIPVARKGYHGLVIEMKRKGGRLSQDQKKWLTILRDNGYATALCFGSEEGIKMVERYFG